MVDNVSVYATDPFCIFSNNLFLLDSIMGSCYHVTGRILIFSSVSGAIIILVVGRVINEQVGQPGERQGQRTLGLLYQSVVLR